MQLARESGLLREELDSLVLDVKSQQQRCQLQMNHIATLEQMVDKERKKNMYLESNSIDKDIVNRQIPG